VAKKVSERSYNCRSVGGRRIAGFVREIRRKKKMFQCQLVSRSTASKDGADRAPAADRAGLAAPLAASVADLTKRAREILIRRYQFAGIDWMFV
jgi:hypothetical protein